MTNFRMPQVRTETEFFAFTGGLDTQSPALRMPPGVAISALNYEPNQNGGYSRMKGYERFDGRPSPSAAPSVATGAVTAAQEAQSLVDQADIRRALIAAVPGSGPVRGVVLYAGKVYAFRDNVGATAGVMYVSSTSGWQAVALGEEVVFTNANTNVTDGDVLTQGGVTATVQRVVVETGSLQSGVNTGRLILTGRTGGNLASGAATSTGSGSLTLSGVQTAITLPPGGKYQFDQYNFFGGVATRRLYGVNGVGRAFEFDGTVFVPLRTGAAVDTPAFIKANRKYLYLAIGSSLINGSVGNPYRFVSGEGAVENGMGDTITGLCGLTGDSLGIKCRNSSYLLSGSSQADWVINTIRDDVGCVPYTLQTMSDTYMFDDRGVTSIQAVQNFGNFEDATLSRKIQPLINRIRNKISGSYVSRSRGLYVLVTNDGGILWMAMLNKQLVGFLDGQLGFNPNCAWSGEDADGTERTFLGGDNGFVYEMDKGSTFDGAAIPSYIKIYYYSSKSPRIRKRYRKMVVEMSAVLYSQIQFRADLTYGDPDVQQTQARSFETGGSGGSWDDANWDEFFWDSQDVIVPEVPLEGTGLNIALQFQSNTKLDFGHTLQGAIIHYTMRRQQR